MNQVLNIKTAYVNDHVLKQFNDRLYASTSSGKNFTIDEKIEMRLLIQREKKGKKINVLKGVTKLYNGLYLIFNLYKNIKTNEIYMKALTILTKKQMDLSNNFGKGNHLPVVINVNIDEIVYVNKFFDYKNYIDLYLNKKWNDDEIIFTLP